MKRVLVPFLSPEDLKTIPNLVRYLRSQGLVSVFVAHSPSLGITSEEATRDVDKRIEDMTRAKEVAVAREDYAGAEQFKQQIEEAKMSRVEIARTGWKSTPVEKRHDIYHHTYDKEFSQLGTLVKRRTLDEDSEDLVGVFAQLKARGWPAELPKGQFSIVFPQDAKEVKGSLPFGAPKPDPALKAEAAKTAEVAARITPPVTAPVDPKEARRKQLSKYMAGKSAAAKLGISMEGRQYSEVVEEILAREFPAA